MCCVKVWFALLETLQFRQLLSCLPYSFITVMQNLLPWLPSLLHYKLDLSPTGDKWHSPPSPPLPTKYLDHQVFAGVWKHEWRQGCLFSLILDDRLNQVPFFKRFSWHLKLKYSLWHFRLNKCALQNMDVGLSVIFCPCVQLHKVKEREIYWKRLLIISIYFLINLFIHSFTYFEKTLFISFVHSR